MLHCDAYAHLTVDDGLQLDLRPHLRMRLLIEPWREGLRLHGTHAGISERWPLGADPGLLLIQPGPRSAAIERFLAPIPKALRESLSRFGYRQFPMLQWLALLDEARALFEHHPVLFWLVADKAAELGWSERVMRYRLRQPLPALLKATVRVDSRCVLRFLRKVVVVNGDRRELMSLRRVLRHTLVVDATRHYDAIAAPLLPVIEHDPSLCDYDVLEQLNEKAFRCTDENMLATVRRCRRLIHIIGCYGAALGIADHRLRIQRCRTLAALQRLCERWSVRMHRCLSLPFPEPPLPDSPTIRAIRNADELFAEGLELRHCVDGHIKRVLHDGLTIYRVLAPQRGTLALSDIDGKLRIEQFSLARNRTPSAASWAAVWEWIDQHAPDARRIRQFDEELPEPLCVVRRLTFPPVVDD